MMNVCVDEICEYYDMKRRTMYDWYKAKPKIVIAMIKYFQIRCVVNI